MIVETVTGRDFATELAERASERSSNARRAAGVSRVIFDEVPVGLLVVDPALSLLDVNSEAVRLLGAESASARTGEHVLELVRETAVTLLLEAALEKGRATRMLTLPAERGGRTLEAVAVRVDERLARHGDLLRRLPLLLVRRHDAPLRGK